MVREVKDDMRERVQALQTRENALHAKIAECDAALVQAREAWREELTLHALALEREKVLRCLLDLSDDMTVCVCACVCARARVSVCVCMKNVVKD